MVYAIDDARRSLETANLLTHGMNSAGTTQAASKAASTISSTAGRAFASVLARAVAPATEAAASTAAMTAPVTVAATVAAPAPVAATTGATTTASTAPAVTPTLDTAQFAALTTATPNQQNLGDGVVVGALDHLGTPYLWGGNDADKGVDCSGLVRDAFRDIGVDMPRVSTDQATMGVEVASIDEALPGDLLAFGNPVNHVGIYLGDNKMVHAPRTGEVVKVEEINRSITTIRRVVDTTRAPDATWTSLDRNEAFGPEEFQAMFEEAGDRWNIDPALLAAVASVESNFDPDAVSSAGATGLMQFMPATAAGLGVDASDPASSIDGAAQYLRQNLDQFGTIPLALAAYNAGPGNVAKYGGIPPFDETQRYVQKVQEAWSTYAA